MLNNNIYDCFTPNEISIMTVSRRMKFEYHNIEYHNSITELQNAISNGIIEYMNFGGYHTSYKDTYRLAFKQCLTFKRNLPPLFEFFKLRQRRFECVRLWLLILGLSRCLTDLFDSVCKDVWERVLTNHKPDCRRSCLGS